MAPIRPAVHILPDVLMPAMTASAYAADLFTALDDPLDVLITELIWWATVLSRARMQTAAPA